MDKSLFYDVSYGMYVVTATLNNQKVGCIANTFSQITSEDMIISISLNKNNWTNETIKQTKKFAVSIISENTNPDVIKKFGFYSSKETDKFSMFSCETISGLPVIKENSCGYFLCDLINIIDCKTHDIFLAKVSNCERFNNFPPMTYTYYHKVIKGKAPKNAPTYIEESSEKSMGAKHQCLLCGYIHDSVKENQNFENLADDWMCPICGSSKSVFVKLSE